ncbi:Tudor domain-containing protein 3 [Nymphon striatum]|nr:Tudor domain-containing protein 3 [Nymphon striatum]
MHAVASHSRIAHSKKKLLQVQETLQTKIATTLHVDPEHCKVLSQKKLFLAIEEVDNNTFLITISLLCYELYNRYYPCPFSGTVPVISHCKHISDSSLNELLEGENSIHADQLITKILDVDLKEYGAKCLPTELARGKLDKFDGNVVLQISHIRNVSQPKYLEKELSSGSCKSQMLRVHMTDGTNSCYGLTLSNVTNLSSDVPPGTKIYLKPTKISVRQGFILLDNNVCKVLGGKVQHLLQKWELSRNAVNSAKKRSGGEDGNRPPPWVAFGHHINSNVDIKGKALDTNTTFAQGKENAEFDEQRKAVIAEALKSKEGTHTKKTFSTSGVKQINKSDKGMELDVSSKPSGPSTLFDFLNVKMSLNETGNSRNLSLNNPSNTRDSLQNKKPYKTQQSGDNYHQTNKKWQPNAGNEFHGDIQQVSGMRKQYLEKKLNSQKDYQQNQQFKQKYNNANYSVKKNDDVDLKYFENPHQHPNYQKHHHSLDRNQEANFQNRNERDYSSQKSQNGFFSNSLSNRSSGSKFQQPVMNLEQRSVSKHNFKRKFVEGEKVLAKYWEDNKVR